MLGITEHTAINASLVTGERYCCILNQEVKKSCCLLPLYTDATQMQQLHWSRCLPEQIGHLLQKLYVQQQNALFRLPLRPKKWRDQGLQGIQLMLQGEERSDQPQIHLEGECTFLYLDLWGLLAKFLETPATKIVTCNINRRNFVIQLESTYGKI